jgi:tetratricopeptide (TPR) repeat protein
MKMHWTRKQLWVGVAVVLALVACSSGPQEDPLAVEWTALEEAKSTLDAKRQELTGLIAEVAAAAEAEDGEAEGEEGEEAEAPVDHSAQIEALQQEITALADDFGARVVMFLNNDPILAEEGPTERQLAAIRLKSSEDMLVAKEWIDEGGDYRQAIQIYQNSLHLDPDNEELKAALADAEARRYMSEERFAMAKKDMTVDEVRAALGTPLHHNVKTYEDKGVTAWFYPTSEDGAAAAVWFRPNDDEGLISYLIKYEAVPGKSAT